MIEEWKLVANSKKYLQWIPGNISTILCSKTTSRQFHVPPINFHRASSSTSRGSNILPQKPIHSFVHMPGNCNKLCMHACIRCKTPGCQLSRQRRESCWREIEVRIEFQIRNTSAGINSKSLHWRVVQWQRGNDSQPLHPTNQLAHRNNNTVVFFCRTLWQCWAFMLVKMAVQYLQLPIKC